MKVGVLKETTPGEHRVALVPEMVARLRGAGLKVLVQSGFHVPLEGVCKRCLKKVRLDEPIDLTLTYVPRDAAPVEPARGPAPQDKEEREAVASFELDTIDEEPYSGKTVDLAPALREQILLAVPPSPLCDEACRGLL